MVVVPTDPLAVSMPEDDPIVASAVFVLSHAPPAGVAVKVVVVDIHIDSRPLIMPVALTVTTVPTAVPQPVV